MALFHRENLDMQWLIENLHHVDVEAAFRRDGDGRMNRAQCLKALNAVRSNTKVTLRYVDSCNGFVDEETRMALNEVRQRTLEMRGAALSSTAKFIIAPSLEELCKIAERTLGLYRELRTDAEVLCMLQRPELVEALHRAF